ncbi:MAG: DUF1707 domain-containing protein [Spirochaetales bacterium]|nr:DUF1707 domain-containing protein [Spirochaetales bacterium]
MSLIDNYNNIDLTELRKEAEERLQWAYAHGHITIESLENRLNELHAAEDKLKIIELVKDLPAPESTDSGRAEQTGGIYHQGSGKKKEEYISILGSNSRRGAWDVPEKIDVFAFLGSQELDFTEARFPRKSVKIDAFTLMGSLDLKVPQGIRVTTRGVPILGSIDNRVESTAEGPEIIIEGAAVLGSITAKNPKSRKRKK